MQQFTLPPIRNGQLKIDSAISPKNKQLMLNALHLQNDPSQLAASINASKFDRLHLQNQFQEMPQLEHKQMYSSLSKRSQSLGSHYYQIKNETRDNNNVSHNKLLQVMIDAESKINGVTSPKYNENRTRGSIVTSVSRVQTSGQNSPSLQNSPSVRSIAASNYYLPLISQNLQFDYPMQQEAPDSLIQQQSTPFVYDEYKKEQIKKILEKRLRKAVTTVQSSKQDQSLTIHQLTEVIQPQVTTLKQVVINEEIQEAIQNQNKKAQEGEIQSDDLIAMNQQQKAAKRERLLKLEIERREKERIAFENKKRQSSNDPVLSKQQTMEKIRYYQLATERRAQEKLKIVNVEENQVVGRESQLSTLSPTQTKMSTLKMTDTFQSGFQVKDKKNNQFRFKLPVIDTSDPNKNTMHSFYSVVQNKNKAQGSFKVRKEVNFANQTGGQSEQDNQSDGQEGEDDHNDTQPITIAASAVQQKHITDAEQHLIEEQEQVQVIGEEFINLINEMLISINAIPEPDNGNQTLTQSKFQQTQQINESNGPTKTIANYAHIIKNQAVFFKKLKVGADEQNDEVFDEKFQYFKECMKNQVLCFPHLNRIVDHTLVLQNLVLSEGICQAIKAVLVNVPTLLHHLYLDGNAMSGSQFQLILEGLLKQTGAFKTLTIQDNAIDEKCVDLINLLTKRRMPEQLDHLKIYYCRIQWQQTDKLLSYLNTQSYLRSLSLVAVSLNDFSIATLAALVQKSKRLVNLDISSNKLVPKQMRKLLESISSNKRLQMLNLGWNTISDSLTSDKDQQEIIKLIGRAIKHNKNLIHLDLTCTGLTEFILKELGSCMRRAASLLAIHLTGNPGLEKSADYLDKRLKCRPKEDIWRYTKIQTLVHSFTSKAPSELKNGIVWKMNQNATFKIKHLDPPETYVLQRFLGFKTEQPGSGQWYEASQSAVPYKKHQKYDCWICSKHVYSILLWSRGQAYVLKPILTSSQAEQVRIEIDKVASDFQPELGFVNGSLTYEQLDDKIPYIAGTFTGWNYKKMIPLHDFTQSLDKEYVAPLETCKKYGDIRNKVNSLADMNQFEQAFFKQFCANQRKNYRVNWSEYLKSYLSYKHPFIINASNFQNINDKLHEDQDELPLEIDTMALQSDSEDTDKQVKEVEIVKPQKKIDPDIPEPPPLPTVPDETKWDIIYCLPFFAKPGNHTYMIKQKNTQQKYQRRLIRKLKRQRSKANPSDEVKQQIQLMEQALQPEVFVYGCNVAQRTEQIVISKSCNTNMSRYQNDVEQNSAKVVYKGNICFQVVVQRDPCQVQRVDRV